MEIYKRKFITLIELTIIRSDLKMYDILDNLIIKFSNEIWIDKLVAGEIFMQPIKNYRDLEIKEQKKGQGDKYEGILRIALDYSYFYSKDNNKNNELIKILNYNIDNAIDLQVEFRFSNDEKYLLACFYKIDKERFVFLGEENGHKQYNYQFTNDEKKVFGNWGDKALIINKVELRNRINSNLDNIGIGFGDVKYYSKDNVSLELLKDFQSQNIRRLLWKDDYFKSQNEFRILINE